MSKDSLMFESNADRLSQKASLSKETIKIKLRFDGYNSDITESYYWFFNFAYYTGKGYNTLKLEDHHYFSEASQYGAQMRQMKGGSIRAFQENLNQLYQLIKVHLFPLLKEVKQSDFYYKWIQQITENDKKVQELVKKGTSDNNPELQKARKARNEAISYLKDEWVTKVDGGRMWQINRSSTEQGLDFALLPQLFFGTSLDDPFETRSTLSEQLNKTVYEIDITRDAKEATARFLHRFYMWLPTAVRETQTTFKLKVITLKQYYSQIQMHIEFMKPLLIEIKRKSETFQFNNMYKNIVDEHPDFVSLLDSSFMYIKTLGIKGVERKGYNFDNFALSKRGLYLSKGNEIISGECKGKKGYITSEANEQYDFYECSENISDEDFRKIKPIKIQKDYLTKFPCIQLEFSQTRRNEIKTTPQGPQALPFMQNTILFSGYAWNHLEIAAYRQRLKNENIELLQTFISELAEIKEDLIYYANYFEFRDDKEENTKKEEPPKNKKEEYEFDKNLILGPFKGLYEMFSPLIPSFSLPKKPEPPASPSDVHKTIKLNSVDDTWKLYSVYKKAHGHMMY